MLSVISIFIISRACMYAQCYIYIYYTVIYKYWIIIDNGLIFWFSHGKLASVCIFDPCNINFRIIIV